jgi:hypothetical protein
VVTCFVFVWTSAVLVRPFASLKGDSRKFRVTAGKFRMTVGMLENDNNHTVILEELFIITVILEELFIITVILKAVYCRRILPVIVPGGYMFCFRMDGRCSCKTLHFVQG